MSTALSMVMSFPVSTIKNLRWKMFMDLCGYKTGPNYFTLEEKSKYNQQRSRLKATRKFIPLVDSRKLIPGAQVWFIQVCDCLLVSSEFMTSGHQIILGWTPCLGWSLLSILSPFSSTALPLTLSLLLSLKKKKKESFFYCAQDTTLKTKIQTYIIYILYVKFII